MRRTLVRCVRALGFLSKRPPSYLFASGNANRLNPQGVSCLYFSESERAADVEYRRGFGGTIAAQQPKLTYRAEVELRHVIDFDDAEALRVLGIDRLELRSPWRTASAATRLQELGLAISHQRRISAVRYPSEALARAGVKGWNVVIYRSALAAPDRVRILGPAGEALEELP